MAFACLGLHLGAGTARAAGTDKGEGAPASATDASPSASFSAQQLTDLAYELHAAGNYAASIATYLKAYEVSGAGVILLNVATIYDRKLHERDLAADYYRRYLRAADAEPDLVLKATQRLTALKQGEEASTTALPSPGAAAETEHPVAAAESHPVLPPFTTPPDVTALDDRTKARARKMRTAGIVTGSIGVAGLTTSVVLGLLAKGKNDDANALCNGDACSNNEGVHLAHQAGNLATASTITFFAGLALAGGGLTIVLLAPREPATAATRLALVPTFGNGGGGVDIEGGF
jgi:hypothetical protein